jgi:putative transposase
MIRQLKDEVPVTFSCSHYGVSTTRYYDWLKAQSMVRKPKKKIICDQIKVIFALSGQTYGSPRIYRELISKGHSISENTVAKYMKEMGLDARLKKKFRVMTTDSNHQGPIAPRIFKSEESIPEKPGEILAGDITYLSIGGTFLYLAVVIDLFNREVVGWSISKSLQSQIVIDALKGALMNMDANTKIIFHSDRGSQYASQAFLELLNQKDVTPSMSRKGNCYDNCYVESWFKSLKTEWIYRKDYQTEDELRALVFEYIEIWYNRKRRHSSLDYLSPIDYKMKYAAA